MSFLGTSVPDPDYNLLIRIIFTGITAGRAFSADMFWRKKKKYILSLSLLVVIYRVFSAYTVDYKEIYDKLEMLTKV